MRTTIRLDPQLLEEAKIVAARTHRTLTKVIEDALRASFERPDSSGRTDKIPPLPVSKRRRGLQPGVALDDNSALLDRMEGQ